MRDENGLSSGCFLLYHTKPTEIVKMNHGPFYHTPTRAGGKLRDTARNFYDLY